MRDHHISFQRAQQLHPSIRDEVVRAVEEAEKSLPANCAVRIVRGKCTKEEQDAIYAQGRTKPGKIVTRAQWYQTLHFYGLSVDFCLLYDFNGDGKYEVVSWDTIKDVDEDKIADWTEVVLVFKRYGFSWGGDWKSFKDRPHFEKSPHSWRILYSKYLNKEFISGTQYVIL